MDPAAEPDTCKFCEYEIRPSTDVPRRWLNANGYWECHDYKCSPNKKWEDIEWHFHEPVNYFQEYLGA